jgi:hypothetical protein
MPIHTGHCANIGHSLAERRTGLLQSRGLPPRERTILVAVRHLPTRQEQLGMVELDQCRLGRTARRYWVQSCWQRWRAQGRDRSRCSIPRVVQELHGYICAVRISYGETLVFVDC